MKNIKQCVGRPKSFDEDQILLLAMNYFWEHGYNDSSLENLLKVMNIKKSSFYCTFSSKEELFSRCLALYRNVLSAQLKDLEKDLGPKETMLMLATITINELKETGKVKGCLLVNSGQECYNKFNNLSQQITSEFNFFMDLFEGFVTKAQNLGEIKSNKNAKILAGRYMNTLNGLIVSIQAGISQEMINDIIESAKEILE